MSDQMSSVGSDVYDIDELLGAYALDAVTADERRRVEDYLEINQRAAAEVREHREVATMLAFSGMDAPSGVWERIEGSIDHPAPVPGPKLAQVLGLGADTTIEAPATASEAPTPPAPTVEPLAASAVVDPSDELAARRERRRDRRRMSTTWLGAAAAAAVVVVVSLGLADRAGAPTSPMADAMSIARADRDSVETTLRAENATMSADAVIDQDGHGFLDATSLPPLAAGQTYQLWGVMADSGDAISLGVLGPNPEIEPFTVEGEVAALAVTIEQSPGVIADGNQDGWFLGEF